MERQLEDKQLSAFFSFALGLLITICFDTSIFQGATTPRWALLAVAIPAFLLFMKPTRFTAVHFLGGLYLLWAAVTLIWSANLWDGIQGMIQFLIITAVFILGGRLDSLKPIFTGLAIGISVSSIILLVPTVQEFFKGSIVLVYPHGLFGNKNMLAEAAALTLVGGVIYRSYWTIGVLPSLFWMPLSRTAIVAVVAAFGVWIWRQSKGWFFVFSGACVVGGLIILYSGYRTDSIEERWFMWQPVLANVHFFGYGLGSTRSLFPLLSTQWDTTHQIPNHPHNEFLSVLLEQGIVGLLLYTSFIGACLYYAGRELPIVVAFLAVSCFAFPWYIPTSAFIGAIVLGHCAARGALVRDTYHGGREILRTWHEGWGYQIAGRLLSYCRAVKSF